MKQVVQRRFQHLVLKKRQCGIGNFLSEAQDYTNSEININEIFESAVKGNVNNKSFFYKILNKLFSETIEAIKSIGIVIIIIIISSILKNITEDLDNKGIQNLTHYVTYILIVTVVMHNFSDIINMCKTSISNLVDFINSLIPLMITLLISTGNITTAGALQPMILFMVTFIGNFINGIISNKTAGIRISDSSGQTIQMMSSKGKNSSIKLVNSCTFALYVASGT